MPFKKGVSPNPEGALPIGDAQKLVRKLTRLEFEKIGNKYLYMTGEDIEKALANKGKVPVLDLAIMSILYHSIKEGDFKRLEWMLERLIGGAVKRIAVITEDVSDENRGKVPVKMSNAERVDMLERYAEMLRKKEEEVIDVSPNNREG